MDMEDCIKNCQKSYKACQKMVTHCVEKGGEHADPEHIRLLMDCADICQTTLNFMARGSDNHKKTCGVCAEICEQCAESCERLADDEEMKQCAEACRRSAESCRSMSF